MDIISTLLDADIVFTPVSIALDTDEEFMEKFLGECLDEFEARYHPSCRLTVWYEEVTWEAPRFGGSVSLSENVFYGRFSVLTCYHAAHHNAQECITTPGEWGYRPTREIPV
jgi:hypothetical protein